MVGVKSEAKRKTHFGGCDHGSFLDFKIACFNERLVSAFAIPAKGGVVFLFYPLFSFLKGTPLCGGPLKTEITGFLIEP